jgi:hypothetical protein
MIDPFLILTPILMLFVVSLLAFVGCDRLYGVYPVYPVYDAPTLQGTAGDATVSLSWVPSSQGDAPTSYNVKRATTTGGPYQTIDTVSATNYTDAMLTNNTTYYYVVSATGDGAESPNSNELALTPEPTSTPFVTDEILGTVRQDFTGLVGMSIQVGANPISVLALGRWVGPGNTNAHTVKVVAASTGADVPGGSIMVPTAGETAGAFAYAYLPAAVVLNPNTAYYIVSQETMGADIFYDHDTTLQTTNVATVTGAVYSTGGTTYSIGGTGMYSYGPVDFRY